MEWLLSFVAENAPYAHWFFFFALMLAGFNVPISEDLVLIAGGVLASTVIPENTWKIFAAIFLGAYLSDWVSYWIGNRLGAGLWKVRWFSRAIRPERFRKIEHYYQRYGFATLLLGRFIPFGVRNCLFMTAGMAKMSFVKFIIADGIACLISNSALFWLAYLFGANSDLLKRYVGMLNWVIFSVFLLAVIAFLGYKWWQARQPETQPIPVETEAAEEEEQAL